MDVALVGTVVEYDEHAGFGWLEAHDGRRLWFHCTQIADGTRTIEVGAKVHYDVVPGHRGLMQAVRISPR